jgi:hypothetical protein
MIRTRISRWSAVAAVAALLIAGSVTPTFAAEMVEAQAATQEDLPVLSPTSTGSRVSMMQPHYLYHDSTGWYVDRGGPGIYLERFNEDNY